MSSGNYNMARASLPALSQIIGLEPEKEPWCAGYAKSQGRRCHNQTNAHGRSRAMHLLSQGTQALRAGQSIEDILEDLAPYVLCKRWHQNQASNLVTRWEKQVCSFLRSQSPPPSPRRQSRDTSVSEPLNARRETSEERCLRLETKILEMERMLARLQNAHHNSAVPDNTRHNATAPTRTPSTDPGYTLDANYQGPRARSSGHTDQTPRGSGILSPVSRQQSTSTTSTQAVRLAGSIRGPPERVRSREAIIQPTATQEVSNTTMTEAARPQASLRMSNVQSRGTTPPHVHSRSPPPRAVQRRTEQAVASVARPPIPTRRTVEGDCGICLCALQEGADDTSDAGDETDNEDEHTGDEEERYEDLVWCKAQCGVNFHKTCMHQWLQTAPRTTCPACRRVWRG
ncbi:uncharacterized protein N7482_007146 [Penicillium canariense]|uniref:RING-type domain-containing protein n=1 Tax=Penicillium canariense TaxID=189055 RepID=A0A9W9LIU4_9EURO|nr:uncharacterized protein N7482_007146 [Penicillium canariense]KAJ5160142.1 hypothetical protein N7482_007146 [Penicillium canariense]